MTKLPLIFLGNGPLADATLPVLSEKYDIIFHARKKEDLDTVKILKTERPEVKAVLASFGCLIKTDLLDLFAPTGGILNLHPSLLPKYRGPSPVESAILAGDDTFGVSIMQLAEKMDAGPVYFQTTVSGLDDSGAPLEKSDLYRLLAETGARWLVENLEHLPTPVPQDDSAATYCKKLDVSLSRLRPAEKSAAELLREIRAFKGWPKSKYDFLGVKDCIIHSAHLSETPGKNLLALKCADGRFLVVDELQPPGKRPMSARAFQNGHQK